MEMHDHTAALVLAAGLSRRMGSINKLMHPLGDETILEASLKNISPLPLAQIYLITGFDEKAINALPLVEKLKTQKKLTSLYNENYQGGMSRSIVCGIKALPEAINQVLIFLGDMPFIAKDISNILLKAARENPDKNIFIPRFEGQNGHPVLWRRALFPELLKLQGDKGAKEILGQNKDQIFYQNVDQIGITIDIDNADQAKNLKHP